MGSSAMKSLSLFHRRESERLRRLKDSKGAALFLIILAIMGLGMFGGAIAISIKAQRDREAIDYTVAKMKRIAIAISTVPYDPSGQIPRHYEDDVGALPATLDNLTTVGAACTLGVNGKLSGWCGPYWTNNYSGEDINKDGWNQDFTLNTGNRTLRSRGPDQTDDSGGSDDLVQVY